MWNREFGSVYRLIAEKKDIKIDRARPPALAPHTAELLLNFEEFMEQGGRRQRCFQCHDAVQIARLVLNRAYRIGFNRLRRTHHLRLGNFIEKSERVVPRGQTVAEIGAEADIGKGPV